MLTDVMFYNLLVSIFNHKHDFDSKLIELNIILLQCYVENIKND